jgi:hypothetical protein
MDLRKGGNIEMRVIAPAHMLETVLDIGPRLFNIKRPQVALVALGLQAD